MIGYIDYLGLPGKVGFGIVVLFFLMQIIGELLEFRGKIVPEFLKIRKYFQRKKQEREIIQAIPASINDLKTLVQNHTEYYSKDWYEYVNNSLKDLKSNDATIADLSQKLDKNNSDTLSLLIDNKRNAIIDFASFVVDDKAMVTREQYNRIFKIHKEYEDIIAANGLTNGEVDIAFRIISESYEKHLKDRTFIEDVRGY